MFNLAPLLLAFPLIGALINGFFGRRIVKPNSHGEGELISGWIAAIMSLLAFVVALALFFALRSNMVNHVVPEGCINETTCLVKLFDWFRVGDFYIPWEMHIDTLSSVMLLVVTGVGSLIHIYAIGYMHGDKDFPRFFTYLNLFMFFMLILVTGSSFLVLFVGWEGVGLASFLLIGFWFDKDRKIDGVYEGVLNSNAAMKAFVANRFGDLFMILAMSIIFWKFGSMRFVDVFPAAAESFGTDGSLPKVLSIVVLFLLLGAAGKSAQIPFFVWLPDAMAGPTPVSALMHAATMVTSGIYLLVRSNVFIEIARYSHYELFGLVSAPELIALAGAITALYAGLVAFTQFDIKKVLAYSTVSQLGFMIAAVGMGAYVAAMFHLVTHAFFKALLFMGAGSVIHGMEHGHHHLHDHGHGHDDDHAHDADHHDDHHAEDDFDPQDMRYMGNIKKYMPWTTGVYIIGAIALAGIFPFAGFWSKDEILAHASFNGLGLSQIPSCFSNADQFIAKGFLTAEQSCWSLLQGNWIFAIVGVLLTLAAVCTAFYMGRQLKMVFFGHERHEATHHAHESNWHMVAPLLVLAFLSMFGGALNIPYLTEQASITGLGKEIKPYYEPVDHDAVKTKGTYDKDVRLELEHWLEPSIDSFRLSDEHVVHMPHTPWFQRDVAIQSSVLAVGALAISFLFVYGGYSKREKSADDPDPIFKVPLIGSFFTGMQRLPLNTLYMDVFRKAFNWFSWFCGHVIDWDFYHDFVHEYVLRAPYLAISKLAARLDRGLLDGGILLLTSKLLRGLSGAYKNFQTGYVRNYALMLFLGVVALVVYFMIG